MSSLNVYEVVVQLIGVLPPTLEWVYGLTTALLLFLLLYLVVFPFVYIMTWRR